MIPSDVKKHMTLIHPPINVHSLRLDTDKDGVPDYRDCNPFNRYEQGWLHDRLKGTSKFVKERYADYVEDREQKHQDSRQARIEAHEDFVYEREKLRNQQKLARIKERQRQRQRSEKSNSFAQLSSFGSTLMERKRREEREKRAHESELLRRKKELLKLERQTAVQPQTIYIQLPQQIKSKPKTQKREPYKPYKPYVIPSIRF